MNPAVSFHEAAENELNDAIDFYDLVNPGLGDTFLDEVQKTIKSILTFPGASPLIRGRVRKKILIKFPSGGHRRTKGVAQIARETRLGRESLYKALSPEGNPEFATVLKVVRALGLRFHATTAHT